MWHLFHFVVRPAEALLGVFCVLTAIVLYPNEEGVLQSKFEDFWIKVDDYQRLALSRHAAFMQQVAKLETRFLDATFGRKLISTRSVAASFAGSLGIPSAIVLVANLLGLNFLGTEGDGVASGFVFVNAAAIGIASFLGRRALLGVTAVVAIEIIWTALNGRDFITPSLRQSFEFTLLVFLIVLAFCVIGFVF